MGYTCSGRSYLEYGYECKADVDQSINKSHLEKSISGPDEFIRLWITKTDCKPFAKYADHPIRVGFSNSRADRPYPAACVRGSSGLITVLVASAKASVAAEGFKLSTTELGIRIVAPLSFVVS